MIPLRRPDAAQRPSSVTATDDTGAEPDASNFRGGSACGVAFPENEKETVDFLRQCESERLAVTVAGNGTGLTGARVPMGGWVLATSKLCALRVNAQPSPGAPARAVVGPGVLLKDLQAEAARAGLFYPSDPTSILSFLGGNVATNASGSRAFKYGVTRDHVLRLRVALSTGEMAEIPRGRFFATSDGRQALPVTGSSGKTAVRSLKIPDYKIPAVKHAAGYFVKPGMDALDLFIGSEGTLGVVTEIELNLLPEPAQVLAFVVFFPAEEDAWNFSAEAQAASRTNRRRSNDALLQARSFEYMDKAALGLVRQQYPEIPASAAAALYLEQECQPETSDMLLEQWSVLFEKHHASLEDFWVAETPEEQQKFRAFRHEIPLQVKAFLLKYGQTKVGTDYAVPEKSFRAMALYEKKRLAEEGLYGVSFGHMADCHLHLNILPRSDGERAKAWQLYGELVDQALRFGGTVSAEHGIGKLKTDFLEKMFGAKAIAEMAALKKQLDPSGILGRGTLFAEDRLG